MLILGLMICGLSFGFSDMFAEYTFNDMFGIVEKAVDIVEETKQTFNAEGRRYRVVLFSAKWCGPCQQLKRGFPWLRNGGWAIGGPEAHIEVIDYDEYEGLWSKYFGNNQVFLPSAALIKDGKPIETRIIYGPQDLIDLYNTHFDDYN